MSFILDALKKSEAERKRQDAPGIANIPQSTENRGGSRWIWVIVGLLAVNLVVLTGVVLKPDSEPANEQTATSLQSPAAEPAVREQVVATAPSPAATAPASPAVASPMTDQPADQQQSPPVAAPAPVNTVTLPTFEALRSQGQLSLPDMHVDIHVYSGQPADRFVFVNMSKYREKATLSEGPIVEEITPDGVVLEYFGTRFLLPRE